MAQRVAPNLESGAVQFAKLRPGQETLIPRVQSPQMGKPAEHDGIALDGSDRDEEGCRNSELEQNRRSILQVVFVSVVERDRYTWLRGFDLLTAKRHQLPKRYELSVLSANPGLHESARV